MKILITEEQLLNVSLRRNIGELSKYIKSAYKWLNPISFYNFDEFLNRVAFSTTRDYVADFGGNKEDVNSYYLTIEKFQPFVKDIVINEYYDEVLKYYNSGI